MGIALEKEMPNFSWTFVIHFVFTYYVYNNFINYRGTIKFNTFIVVCRKSKNLSEFINVRQYFQVSLHSNANPE